MKKDGFAFHRLTYGGNAWAEGGKPLVTAEQWAKYLNIGAGEIMMIQSQAVHKHLYPELYSQPESK